MWRESNGSSYPLQRVKLTLFYCCLFCFVLHISFLLQQYVGTSVLEIKTSTNVFSSVGHCLRQCFPRDPVPRETTAGYTLGTKVCMPNMQYTGGPGSSQVPWCMVLDPKDPTKALSSTNRCQVVEMESDKGCLIWPCC